MSISHLKSLEQALAQRGWRIVAVHPGDGIRISASWEVERSTQQASHFIDFDGMEPMGRYCLPLEESYACRLRRRNDISLYFRRKIVSRQEHWTTELETFLDALDKVATNSE